jgi:hypothetical protein
MKLTTAHLSLAAIFAFLATTLTCAQDLQKNVTYVCNGERLIIDSCNMRDLSDTSTCMVGHPDTVLPNGLMKYTHETRGALKKLLPTCKQPSAEQIARAKAFEKKQNDLYEANVKKANDENNAIEARAQAVITGKKPQTAEERAISRCITSGRLPASCTGNALLGAFSQMISSALPLDPSDPQSPANVSGPNMAGVFQGAGGWRLDFIDGGVLVNCSVLAPNEEKYTIDFKNNRTAIIISTSPKPLNLTLRPDGTIVGAGPVVLDGVINAGYKSDYDSSARSGYYDKNGVALSNSQVSPGSSVYDAGGSKTTASVNPSAGHTTFASKRVTCPALNLSSKGASVGVQTMQTDLLKNMFGGEKGPPTPPGIRMHGIFAAPTGFSVQFFPESAILGCGPDAARAYPYSVVADGTKAAIQVAAPDHPLNLILNPDGSLTPNPSGAYQVHGRTLVGQDNNGDFTFAPLEQACNLAALTPSKAIPLSGGAAAGMTASSGSRGTATANFGGTLSTPDAPLGNATLSVVSGLPAQPGAGNPLAGRPLLLLRDSYANSIAKSGVTLPPGVSVYKFVGTACASRTPDCQKMMDAVKAASISAVRADAKGSGTMPGVPPGTYYLMISARLNNHGFVWGQAVQLKAGQNSITLDQSNAVPLD